MRTLAAVLFVLVVATGCGGPAASPSASSPAPAAQASAAKPSAAANPAAASISAKPAGTGQFSGGDPNGTPLKISYASPAVADSPFYAALSQGFFQQQHLNVTLLMMPPNVAVPALSKGEIDIVDSPSNALEGATRGLPFKVIFAAWRQSPWNLVGKPQYNVIADLKGKRVGTNQAGSTPYLYLQAGLKKAGLTINDIEVVSSGGTILSYQQMIAGTTEAAVLSPPFDAQAELGGFHQVQFLGDLLQFPYIGAGTSITFLSAHHAEVVAFLKAMIDANRWLKGHPDEAAALIVKYIGVTPEVARKSADQMLPQLFGDSFEPSAEGIQQYLDLQAQITSAKTPLTAGQVTDYGPLHEALAKS